MSASLEKILELQYEAELQEEEMLQQRMACALDPANKTPGHEDRLPIATASTTEELSGEGHARIHEYAVNSTCGNNDHSKNPSDGENMSEISNEELQSVHD